MSDLFTEEKVNWADAPKEEEKEIKKEAKKEKKAKVSKKTKMELIFNSQVKDWASEDAPTIANLSKGDIVSVGDEEGDYIEVRITKSVVGYVKKSHLK